LETTATSGLPANAKWSSVMVSRTGTTAVAVAYGADVYTSSNYGQSWTAESNSNLNWTGAAVSGDGTSFYGVVRAGQIYRRTTSAGAPTISAQPANSSKTESQTATFSVTAASPDGGTLSYQWNKNGTPIDTATNTSAKTASLTLSNITQASDSATYTVVVTNTLAGTSATTPSSADFDDIARTHPNRPESDFDNCGKCDCKSSLFTIPFGV
jgi:hypothetical protein